MHFPCLFVLLFTKQCATADFCMEKLLHYVWKNRLLPSEGLTTTDGKSVVIKDPGQYNTNQGPDFINARIEIDGMLWAGDVEIHTNSADWTRHGHHLDPVYNTTILHVVERATMEVCCEDGQNVPQMIITVPQALKDNYHELLVTTDYPRCHRFVGTIPQMKVHSWLDSLFVERMQNRSRRILDILKECCGDWERTTFITLARNFGFGLNGDVFEMWAKQIPLSAAGKHRDNLFQIESLFLGQAGLIDKLEDEQERSRLHSEHRFLSHKFTLPTPMTTSLWHYLRIRPQNFPDVRLRQFARLFHEGHCSMDSMLGANTVDKLDSRLAEAGMSKGSRNLIIINTVAPLLYAYDIYHGTQCHRVRATEFLEQLPGENNRILRQWQECGIKVGTAYDSQALLQLKKEYCDHVKCPECRFGYEYLSHIARNEG